jgi:hypothetical protein
MNIGEKIAGAYLRLNGFLLLPNFTTFLGDHNHADLVGFRVANSAEIVEAPSDIPGEEPRRTTLLTDDKLFELLTAILGSDARKINVGLIGEVKANRVRDNLPEAHARYVKDFLGGIQPVCVSFYDLKTPIQRDGRQLLISLHHAWNFIRKRIDWMDNQEDIAKSGSWTLSEDSLSDILLMNEKGFLTQNSE